MPKMNRMLIGFFLVLWVPAGFLLHAEELPPVPEISQKGVPTTVDDATPGIGDAVQMAQEEVRDPFSMTQSPEPETPVTVVAPVGSETQVALQGLGFGSQDAYAVIGGDVFYIGDEKKGIKLLEVRRREVDVLVNGGLVTVPLFPDEDLQKAKDRAEKKNTVKGASSEKQQEAQATLSGGGQPPL